MVSVVGMSESTDKPCPGLEGRIPEENTASTIENYGPKDEIGEYAKELAFAFVDAPGTAGLMLVGEPGNGKTHLAVGIAKEMAARGRGVVFVSFKDGGPDFGATKLGDYFSSPEPHQYIQDLIQNYDCLIFDDLPGGLYPGVCILMQTILLWSYNAGKKLVFTSNQPAGVIRQQLSTPVDQGQPGVDMQRAIAERFEQAWQVVEFRGVSHRSTQTKWYAKVERPAGIDRAPLGSTHAFKVLGGAVVELAASVGVTGPRLEALREIVEDFEDE